MAVALVLALLLALLALGCAAFWTMGIIEGLRHDQQVSGAGTQLYVGRAALIFLQSVCMHMANLCTFLLFQTERPVRG